MYYEFEVLETNLSTEQTLFANFLEDIYLSFYRKDRFRHITTLDKRFPKIQTTDDIFKLVFYYKDKKNSENYMYLDGTVNLGKMNINLITLNKYELFPSEVAATVQMFKLFSKHSSGYIIFIKNNSVHLVTEGIEYSEKEIIDYMVNTPVEERKDSFVISYNFCKEFSSKKSLFDIE